MRTQQRYARAAAMLAVLVAAIAATAAPAAAFSYTIDVVGEGVTGTGSILFPADAGEDPTGVDLTLTATLFGNVVTFTEAHILSVGWAGAAPADLIPLVIANLALAQTIGSTTFLLSDDGGNIGSAICSSLATVCGGAEVALALTSWTYTERPVTPVSEASTAFMLLAGLGLVTAWRGLHGGRALVAMG